jgi:uncharacterized protein (TIGR02246 family)
MRISRFLLALCLSLTSLVSLADVPLQYTGVSTLPSNSEEREIAQLFDGWNAALASNNPRLVAERYAPNAVLLPTVSNQVRSNRAQIEDYFAHFLQKKPQGVINYRQVRLLDANNAVDAGVYTFTLTEKDGARHQVQARYSFVYEKINGQWLIVNHHSSVMPEIASAEQSAH